MQAEGLADVFAHRFFLLCDHGAVWCHFSVEFCVASPFFWQVVFVEDRLNRTFWNAGFAIDTFIRMNVKNRFTFVEAFDWADDNAVCVFAVKTWLSDNVCHPIFPFLDEQLKNELTEDEPLWPLDLSLQQRVLLP